MSTENIGDILDNPEGGGEAETTPDLSALQKEIESLKANLKTMHGNYNDAQQELMSSEYLEFLSSKDQKPQILPGDKEEEEGDDFEQFDMLSNSELARKLTASQKAEMKTVLDGLKREIETREQERQKFYSTHLAKVDLEFAQVRHSDLRDKLSKDQSYREAFIQAAQDNPNWGAEKVYRFVEMERSYNERQEIESKKAQGEKELRAVQERLSAPTGVTVKKNLSEEELMEAAYRIAFGTKE